MGSSSESTSSPSDSPGRDSPSSDSPGRGSDEDKSSSKTDTNNTSRGGGGADSGSTANPSSGASFDRAMDNAQRPDRAPAASPSNDDRPDRAPPASPNDDSNADETPSTPATNDERPDRAPAPTDTTAGPTSPNDDEPSDKTGGFFGGLAGALSAPPTDASGNPRSESPVADRINNTVNYSSDKVADFFGLSATTDPDITPAQSNALATSAAVMNGYVTVPASMRAIPTTAELVLNGMYARGPGAPATQPVEDVGMLQTAEDAVLGAGELVGGVAVGAVTAAKDMVVGTADFAWEGAQAVVDYPGALMNKALSPTGFSPFEAQEQRHDQRMQATVDFVTSIPDMPGQVMDSAEQGLQTFEENWDAGNYYDLGKQIGSLGAEVAAVAVPVAKAGKLSKIDNVAPTTAVDRRLNQMYDAAPAAKMEIDELAGTIAVKYDAHVAEAPLKSRERATEKAVLDYEGDASRINDLARNTIVVSKDRLDAVTTELKERGARVKQISPESNPAGYSGVNAVIETKAGIKAEVQVNTPEMIYAKEPEPAARGILGDDVYDDIAQKTGVSGGRGHTLYEERRVLDETEKDRAREIEKESREYYKNFQ